MPISERLFICLKETCFPQQLAADLEARPTLALCTCKREKWECEFYYHCFSWHHNRAVWERRYRYVSQSPSVSNMLYGAVTGTLEETVANQIPREGKAAISLMWVSQTVGFFPYLQNILSGWCENQSRRKDQNFTNCSWLQW